MSAGPYKIGYFDEAYNDTRFILGGWVFVSVAAADGCARDFSAECARYPINPDFHMQPARDALSEQWDWGQDCALTVAEKFIARDRRFVALLECVLRHNPTGFYVVLDRGAYDAIYRGKVPKSRDSEYFVLFYYLLFSIARHYAEAGVAQSLQPVFDMQDEFSPLVARWFNKVIFALAVRHPQAATVLSLPPRFEHDSTTPPLKAADMLTWLVLRLQTNKLGDATIKLLLDRIMEHGGKARFVDAKILTEFRALQRQDRTALAPGELLAPL